MRPFSFMFMKTRLHIGSLHGILTAFGFDEYIDFRGFVVFCGHPSISEMPYVPTKNNVRKLSEVLRGLALPI